MNKKNVKRYIDKINILYDNVLTDDELSEMEKKLLLSYTKSLYESIIEGEDESYELLDESIEIEAEIEMEEEQADLEEIHEDGYEEAEDIEIEDDTTEPEEQPLAASAELVALFDEKEAKEVSDRLGRLPIKDISKAMSINEKILTRKELFADDGELFKDTIAALNNLSTFEEAKDYLIRGVASDQDWEKDDRHKKAVHFIQLIKRRYK